jgi:serine/threonine-protein kinase RsbW
MSRIFKELTIPSSTDSLTRVEKFVDEICEAYYITNSYYGNILMAILEAVKNAITHGNKNDVRKKVKIGFKSVPDGLCFTVSDQGPGFDFRNVQSPIDTDDTKAENAGKGIFLIRSLADRISYNSKGNLVEIIFSISSINQETSLNRISKLHQYFTSQKTLAK